MLTVLDVNFPKFRVEHRFLGFVPAEFSFLEFCLGCGVHGWTDAFSNVDLVEVGARMFS